MTTFNTIQYCINNSIPCFTFKMDSSKKVWKKITSERLWHGQRLKGSSR